MALERIALGNLSIVYERSVFDHRDDLRDFASGLVIRSWADRGDNMIVTLGGDGTLLRAVRAHAHEWLPFLGINFGHKGFLLSDPATLSAETTFESLSFPLLENELIVDDRTTRFDSLNETVVKTIGPSIVKFKIGLESLSIDVAWDGIIVSTPAGSTGYSRSVGGPILPHDANCLIVSPIAAFDPPAMRPVVIRESEGCSIHATAPMPNTLCIFSDAEMLAEDIRTCEIAIRKSERSVSLLMPSESLDDFRSRAYSEQGFKFL